MDFDSEEDNAEHNFIRSVLINKQTSAKGSVDFDFSLI